MLQRWLSSPGSNSVVIVLFLLGPASILGAQPYNAPKAPLASPSIGASGKTTGAPAVTADSPATGPLVFAYDAAGRLVGMADAVGNTATYTYDAAGNILSIGRGSSSASILALSPSSGPVGTNVTIVGSGFGATAAQNSVTFNGVSAALVTATPNQLVAVVPSGATTGPIRVICPAGSAVSTTSFTVVPNNAPSISSFTPTIGTAGTPVTITGTNFEPVAGNNKLIFNVNIGSVSSATPTTLGTAVSSTATSGPITVSTPNGRATSTGDFFVPPSPYTAADVAATGRMAIGETRTVTISQANKIGLIVFSGSAGQRISLAADLAFTVSGCGFVSILRPDGTTLAVSDIECGGIAFIDAQVLPISGTYQIVFDPLDTATGTATLTLYNVPPDVTAAIVPGGSPVTVTTTTPGQNAVLTFAGSMGQRISLAFNVALPGGGITCGYVSILRPGGTALANSGLQCGPGFIDVQVLPVSGTYRIVVDPLAYLLGSARLTLYNVPPDVTAAIVPGGPPVTVTTSTPGQNAVLTFAGSAGQRIVFDFNTTLTAGSLCGSLVSIFRPDGIVLVDSEVVCVGPGFVDLQVLPISGTYQIVFKPVGTVTGSTTVNLEIVPPDVTATIVPGASPVTVTTTTPGQNAVLMFAGSAGQRISIAINAELTGCGFVSILGPDGSALVEPGACLNRGFIDLQVLPVTGTYQIVFNPYNTTTGSVTVTLYNVPPDVTGAIVPGGSPVTVTTTTPGQNAFLTFAGSAGQHISLGFSLALAGGENCGFMSILRPDGSPLLYPIEECATGFIDLQVLPVSGTYQIVFDSFGLSTGNTTLTLFSFLAVTSIFPQSGMTLGGTPIVLTGANFQNGATVLIGGVAATGVLVVDSSTISAMTGAHGTGAVDVVVINPSTAPATLPKSFFYTPPPSTSAFYTLTPCRLIDTRNPSGPLGGPILAPSSQRTFTATGGCGIPPSARSVSANVTVVTPAMSGSVGLYPGNAFPLGTSSVSFPASLNRSNNVIIELATDGSGTFGVTNSSPGTTHLIVDVNGYFQ